MEQQQESATDQTSRKGTEVRGERRGRHPPVGSHRPSRRSRLPRSAASTPAIGVLEIDLITNEERQLRPGETIELNPGMGFAKKRRFRRG